MAHAMISIVSLYNYDSTLFDGLELPEGIDKDAVVNNILLEAADCEVLYPNLDFFKLQIAYFSKKYARTFTKWYEALEIEYEPLENYDRIENWNDSGNSKTTPNLTTTNRPGTTTTSNVSAFDSSSMQPDTSVVTSGTDTTTQTGNSASQFGNKHEGRIHGNIGVTTSQQMLQSELDIAKWNLIQQITDLFLNEFIIMVY